MHLGWVKVRLNKSQNRLRDGQSNTFTFRWASVSAAALVKIEIRTTLHCPTVDNYAETLSANTFIVGWVELRYFPGPVGGWIN